MRFYSKQQTPADSPVRLMIAGAGTGGHLFPGIAVAHTIMARSPGSRTLFVTTGRPIETTVLAKHPFETASIAAAGIKGKSIWAKLKSLALLPGGLLASFRILRQFRPDAVMGMGGYSSGPVIVGAWLMGIPRVIHEQNRLPGMTNRLLGRFADRIYVSFADTEIGGATDRTRFTGNPVREEIRECRSRLDGIAAADTRKPLTIVILGGSQGAHSINMAMIDALDHLDHPASCRFIHQTGVGDAERVRAAYAQKGIAAEVDAFFEDMAGLYRRADLAVCRAGASTVAELIAAHVPAIFIPFPHAADNHQVSNAEGMVGAGAAQMLPESEMNGMELARRINGFASDRKSLDAMKLAICEAMGTNDAAGAIVDDILDLIGRKEAREIENQEF